MIATITAADVESIALEQLDFQPRSIFRIEVWVHRPTRLAYSASIINEDGEDIETLWHGSVCCPTTCARTFATAQHLLRARGWERVTQWELQSVKNGVFAPYAGADLTRRRAWWAVSE